MLPVGGLLVKKYSKFMQRLTIAGQRATRATAPYPPSGFRPRGSPEVRLFRGSPAADIPTDPGHPSDVSRPAIRREDGCCRVPRWKRGLRRLEDAGAWLTREPR